MRPIVLFGSLFALFLASPAAADETEVKKMITEYARAFNANDVDAVSGFWEENGVHIDRETGDRTEGRDAIKADIVASIEQNPGAQLVGRVESVRFVKPDVANVEGEVTLSIPGADPTHTLFSAILVSSNGKWMIDSIEESPVPVPATSVEALKDLDWLIGRWVDESEVARVDTTFRWAASQAFLLRSFLVTTADGDVREGTQVIGWDPRSNEIRSWSFQSDGSFGDATWSKSGNDWLGKSSQTLADGRAASGTFVYSPVSDNEISIRLIGHEIEGEPQPTDAAITIKRVVETTTATEADPTNQSKQPRATNDVQAE